MIYSNPRRRSCFCGEFSAERRKSRWTAKIFRRSATFSPLGWKLAGWSLFGRSIGCIPIAGPKKSFCCAREHVVQENFNCVWCNSVSRVNHLMINDRRRLQHHFHYCVTKHRIQWSRNTFSMLQIIRKLLWCSFELFAASASAIEAIATPEKKLFCSILSISRPLTAWTTNNDISVIAIQDQESSIEIWKSVGFRMCSKIQWN